MRKLTIKRKWQQIQWNFSNYYDSEMKRSRRQKRCFHEIFVKNVWEWISVKSQFHYWRMNWFHEVFFSRRLDFLTQQNMHSVKIAEILSHNFLTKISWNQRLYYINKLLKSWFHEIFFQIILMTDMSLQKETFIS